VRHRRGLVPLMLVIFPAPLLAQRPQCPPSPSPSPSPPASADTAALALPDVERRPVADPANAPPRYPDLLRQAGIAGAVRVTFIVDTAGRVEGATIRIVRSPNPGFDSFVKRAVASWRYAPASLCGRPVRVRLGHEFAFQASATPRDTVRWALLFDADTSVTAATDTLPDGTPRTTVAWRATPLIASSVPWDPAALDSAEETALAHIVEDLGQASSGIARVACLAGKRGLTSDPDSGRLVRLTRPGIALLPSRRCPPTFASMIYTPGERPYPPGEDPFGVHVRTRTPLSSTRVVFDVDVSHGTGGYHHRCGVERLGSGWRARCVIISSWVS
jgi:TonB family protein